MGGALVSHQCHSWCSSALPSAPGCSPLAHFSLLFVAHPISTLLLSHGLGCLVLIVALVCVCALS